MVPFLMRNRSLQPTLARYGLEHSRLLDMMHISQRILLNRPTDLISTMSAPLMSQLPADALRIGVHMRLGDTHMHTSGFDELRYPDGCECATRVLPNIDFHKIVCTL